MKFKTLSASILFLCLSQCAVIDSTIPISYNPSGEETTAGITLDLSQVENRRRVSKRQGIKKNGYGMDMADIFTDPDPESIIRDALKKKFSSSGILLKSGAPVKLKVSVLEFFSETEVGFFAGDVYAGIEADLIITIPSKGAFKRRIRSVEYERTLIWLDSFYQNAFHLALYDFAEQCSQAVIEILRQ